ncbi:MAG TPA: NAD(P)/FAD-dependent oxidoreductase [Actinomycetota bacterium]|nr:NAD(P)/FAD-dependent oxidoreductase [Actinomycetota bacterium]
MAATWIRPYDWCDRSEGMAARTAFAHPGDMQRFDRPEGRKKVGVVGGGVAGLTAAYELSQLSHQVTVFESTDRWGGRIWTERFGEADGPYAELGAMRIPYGHGCVDHYVSKFGLTRRHFVSKNNATLLRFRQTSWRRANWKAAAEHFGSHLAPGPILEAVAATTSPLSSRALWGQVTHDWNFPALCQREERSLAQVVNDAIRNQWITAEDWAWVGALNGFRWLEDASVLFWENVATLIDPHGKYEIAGGMSRFVDEFVRQLTSTSKVTLRLHSPVSALTMRDGAVTVHWQDTAGVHEEQFDYVVVALPAPCVARLDIRPPLSSDQEDALRAVHYFPIAKSAVLCSVRFWERDDRIFGGSTATDLPNQQVWYPNDNAVPMTDDDSDHLSPTSRSVTGNLPIDPAFEPTDWKAASEDVANGPGAITGGYMWGTNALRFGSLDETQRSATIHDCVIQIHPNADSHIQRIVHRVWGDWPSPGGGGFAYFRPTEQRKYGGILCRPHPDPSRGAHPRVFFAGEHDGVAQGWIQGAVQSALAAAASVMSQP